MKFTLEKLFVLIVCFQLISCAEEDSTLSTIEEEAQPVEGLAIIDLINLTSKHDSLYVYLDSTFLGVTQERMSAANDIYHRNQEGYLYNYTDSTQLKVTVPATGEVLLDKQLWLADESRSSIFYILEKEGGVDVKINRYNVPNYPEDKGVTILQVLNLTDGAIDFQQHDFNKTISSLRTDTASFFSLPFHRDRSFSIYRNGDLLYQIDTLPIGDGGGVYSVVVRNNSYDFLTHRPYNQKLIYINLIKGDTGYLGDDSVDVNFDGKFHKTLTGVSSTGYVGHFAKEYDGTYTTGFSMPPHSLSQGFSTNEENPMATFLLIGYSYGSSFGTAIVDTPLLSDSYNAGVRLINLIRPYSDSTKTKAGHMNDFSGEGLGIDSTLNFEASRPWLTPTYDVDPGLHQMRISENGIDSLITVEVENQSINYVLLTGVYVEETKAFEKFDIHQISESLAEIKQ